MRNLEDIFLFIEERIFDNVGRKIQPWVLRLVLKEIALWADENYVSGNKGDTGDNGKSLKLDVIDGWIKWALEDSSTWNNLVNLSSLQGADGKTPQLVNNGTHIQVRLGDSGPWADLVPLSILKGNPGVDGSDGVDGATPTIGENGNWWIGGVDTGVRSMAVDGASGLSPHIGENGNWWVGAEDTGILANQNIWERDESGNISYATGKVLIGKDTDSELADLEVYGSIQQELAKGGMVWADEYGVFRAAEKDIHYLSGTHPASSITISDLSNWDDAYVKRHTHINKVVLDAIEAIDLTNWDNAYTLRHSHSNKSILDAIEQPFTTALKSKLDGIAFAANNYVLPIATYGGLGGIRVGANLNIDAVSGVLDAVDTTYGGSTSVVLVGSSFQRAALTGDVTAPQNSNVVTIAAAAVGNSKLSNMASGTLKGRAAAGVGSPEDLTPSQVRTLLNVSDGANNYIHPSGDGNLHVPATGTSSLGKFLKAGAIAASIMWAPIAKADITDFAHQHPISEISGLQASLEGKEPGFSKGNIVQGSGLNLSGTLTGRLYGAGSITAAIDPSYTGFDARYYTESEMDGFLAGKASAGHNHSFDSLSNVSISVKFSGDLARWSGSAWTNWTPNFLTGNQVITLTGDISGSGATNITAAIAAGVVTNSKLSNMASGSIKGRVSAASGSPEDLTPAQVRALLNVADGANNYAHPNSGISAGTYNNVTVNLQGHVTAGSNVAYLTSIATLTRGTGLTGTNYNGTAATTWAFDTTFGDARYALKAEIPASGNFIQNQNGGFQSATFAITGNALAGGIVEAGRGVSTGSATMRLGYGRTDNGYAVIDFIGDTVNSTAYSFRILRNNSGDNAHTDLRHRGAGQFRLMAENAGHITFWTDTVQRVSILHSTGRVLIGSSSDTTLAQLQVSGAIQQTSVTNSLVKTNLNGVFVQAAASDITALVDATYVKKSGDTMSGPLNFTTLPLLQHSGVNRIRVASTNSAADSIVVSGAGGGVIYLRPNGDDSSTSQLVVSTVGIGWGGYSIFHASNFPTLKPDLEAIELLPGTSGLLRKTAANTWTLDTEIYATSTDLANYITKNTNQSDLSGSKVWTGRHIFSGVSTDASALANSIQIVGNASGMAVQGRVLESTDTAFVLRNYAVSGVQLTLVVGTVRLTTLAGTGIATFNAAGDLGRVAAIGNSFISDLSYTKITGAPWITGNQVITLSGDISGSGATSITAAIAAGVVTNAKLSNMASGSIKGRVSAASGSPEDLTPAQVRALLNVAEGANNYTHPNSGVSAGTYNNVTVNLQGHVTAGSNINYLTSETDPTVPGHVKAITGTQISQWDSAFGWGNHSSYGYLTSLPGHSLGFHSDVSISSPIIGQLLRYNGTSWTNWTPNFLTGNQVITLSGAVTGSGATSIITTLTDNVVITSKINNSAVTFAKMQNIASGVILGRATASSGAIETLGVGTGLAIVGGNLTATGIIPTNYVTTDSAQLSILGDKMWKGVTWFNNNNTYLRRTSSGSILSLLFENETGSMLMGGISFASNGILYIGQGSVGVSNGSPQTTYSGGLIRNNTRTLIGANDPGGSAGYMFVVNSGSSTGDGLYVNGRGFFSDDVTFFSDSRLKSGFECFKNPVSDIRKIVGYKYIYNGHQDYGVLTDDVEAVLPHAVHIAKNGYRTLSYRALHALEIEAIKELDDKKADKEEIERLKKRVEFLEKQLYAGNHYKS